MPPHTAAGKVDQLFCDLVSFQDLSSRRKASFWPSFFAYHTCWLGEGEIDNIVRNAHRKVEEIPPKGYMTVTF